MILLLSGGDIIRARRRIRGQPCLCILAVCRSAILLGLREHACQRTRPVSPTVSKIGDIRSIGCASRAIIADRHRGTFSKGHSLLRPLHKPAPFTQGAGGEGLSLRIPWPFFFSI